MPQVFVISWLWVDRLWYPPCMHTDPSPEPASPQTTLHPWAISGSFSTGPVILVPACSLARPSHTEVIISPFS